MEAVPLPVRWESPSRPDDVRRQSGSSMLNGQRWWALAVVIDASCRASLPQLIEELVIRVAPQLDRCGEENSQSIQDATRIRWAVAIRARQENGLELLGRTVAKDPGAGQEASLELRVRELEPAPLRVTVGAGGPHRTIVRDLYVERVTQLCHVVHSGIVSDVLSDGRLAPNVLVLLSSDPVRFLDEGFVLAESSGDLQCPRLAG